MLKLRQKLVSNQITEHKKKLLLFQRVYQASTQRTFSLFNKGQTAQAPEAAPSQPAFAAVSQQRSSEEISRSIENYKQSIKLKTQAGLTLSR